MFNRFRNRSISAFKASLIFAILLSVLAGGALAPLAAQSAKPSVSPTLPRGRTLAFRPLTDKNLKKGLKYQVFETVVTGYTGPDTTYRDSLVTISDVLLGKTKDGYSVKSTPRSSFHFENGEKIDDPFALLPLGVSATLSLKEDGTAYDFSGLEAIQQKIRAQFPADSAERMIKSMSGPAVSQRAVAEWNGRLRSLLNREIVIGNATFDTSQIQLPNGHRLPSFIVSRIEDTIRIQGVWHLKVRVSAATSPKDISTTSGLSLREIIRGFKMADSTLAEYPLSKGTMTMKTDLLVEMNTLLIKTEEFQRAISMEPELKNNEAVFTRVISYRRSLRYQY